MEDTEKTFFISIKIKDKKTSKIKVIAKIFNFQINKNEWRNKMSKVEDNERKFCFKLCPMNGEL